MLRHRLRTACEYDVFVHESGEDLVHDILALCSIVQKQTGQPQHVGVVTAKQLCYGFFVHHLLSIHMKSKKPNQIEEKKFSINSHAC